MRLQLCRQSCTLAAIARRPTASTGLSRISGAERVYPTGRFISTRRHIFHATRIETTVMNAIPKDTRGLVTFQ
jgi:hypothetical protein